MLKKTLSSLFIKFSIIFFEKRYRDGNRQYRYLLQKASSPEGASVLMIVFSGFPRAGAKAGYNYIRTLKNMNCHKLFLLDNFGFQKRGAYYLAEKGDFFIEQALDGLIREVCQRLNIRETIYLGSSKGGYAALYYGLKNGAAAVIAGSPQYYLGKYLSLPGHKPILAAMMGDDSPASATRLDRLLKEQITASRFCKPKVFLHYSQNEPAYATHLRDLVHELQQHGFALSQNIGSYSNHGDLVHYFPAYLLEVLTGQLGVPRKRKIRLCLPGVNRPQ